MAGLFPRDEVTELPKLRREVIVPKAADAFAFHRRLAVLSILVAMLAGGLDAMLWRDAQQRAERARVEAELAAQRAALQAEVEDALVIVERAAPAVATVEERPCARRHRHGH